MKQMNSFFPSKTVLLSITSNVRLFGICFLSAKEPHGPFYSELGKSPLLIVDMASEIKDNLTASKKKNWKYVPLPKFEWSVCKTFYSIKW